MHTFGLGDWELYYEYKSEKEGDEVVGLVYIVDRYFLVAYRESGLRYVKAYQQTLGSYLGPRLWDRRSPHPAPLKEAIGQRM